MQDQLDQISAAEKAVFKNALAGAIYLELKSRPRRFSELESIIACSTNSLSRNLRKGKEIGVWEDSGGHYRLTSTGEALPEIIAVHAKLQQDHEVVYKGTEYTHMDVTGGSSGVIDTEGSDGAVLFLTENYKQASDSETTAVESAAELLEWFNPETFSNI